MNFIRFRISKTMPPLSETEEQVVRRLAAGKTKKEAASELHKSIHTITQHTRNSYEKTGCKNLADITRWTIERIYKIDIDTLVITILVISITVFLIENPEITKLIQTSLLNLSK